MAVEAKRFDVVVIGAGPTGLTLTNYLGQAGVSVLLLEKLPHIIDYPRGVGVDDEALRSFQTLGLDAEVRRHVTPFHAARFIRPDGKVLATIDPTQMPFGWARRNAFNQPLVDRELYLGLSRFPNVEIRFEADVRSVADVGGQAVVTMADGSTVAADYLVGCDGGRSIVRETMGVAFDGKTAPKRFIVVDVANDPIGRPNLDFVLHPTRPLVSIALPGQIRRFEFGVEDNEVEGDIDITEEAMRAKLRDVFTDGEIDKLKIIRRRVYTHNARIASSFRKGRLILAGDAAHLMPVWQGQGFNSGIRDATNLGWKLAMVVQGKAAPALLDTYHTERHDHAKAMIDVSVAMGKIFAPPNALQRFVRDVAFAAVARVPSWREWIATMRWKPMPKMRDGALVPAKAIRGNDPVGTIFPQFRVEDVNGVPLRSDDALGTGFALVSWGSDPVTYFDGETARLLEAMGGRAFTIFPACQKEIVLASSLGSTPLFDPDGSAKGVFDRAEYSTFLVRPDRIVGAAGSPVDVARLVADMANALALTGR
ncbi:3-(3-hydroxyphenyl)propionate hydroxylase [Novosphingobium nitrogenifigens DSM 19370]|uniref:3-(3-hydroxyphenyl)propionate hydroxylase n=1 Tax=Novosphingobium nitrogenifigens DSM 19370 TaxID=983920 RepID=F1ZC17_9SPHN|nr:bifunctional 3-(3-hydroxy-phenyl)propionate/3-hydroxycinnamic acid hydroxylase [Novosphingobium nitrogenifigens]EGD57846.1 3-(3-hydroxyphenyl)propionate hydroxylase [Novosphingobium nitrogenifigens DSM 19370]